MEKDDRGYKFLQYTTYGHSIQEYMLINWECMLVQTYTREGSQWMYTGFMNDDDVTFNSIGLTVPH
jgi:hypothetical protein